MFAAEIGRMAGCGSRSCRCRTSTRGSDPHAFHEHTGLPTLRATRDLLVDDRQEVQGLAMGGDQRTGARWMADETSYDAIPGDFNGRLLAENRGPIHRNFGILRSVCWPWPTRIW